MRREGQTQWSFVYNAYARISKETRWKKKIKKRKKKMKMKVHEKKSHICFELHSAFSVIAELTSPMSRALLSLPESSKNLLSSLSDSSSTKCCDAHLFFPVRMVLSHSWKFGGAATIHGRSPKVVPTKGIDARVDGCK